MNYRTSCNKLMMNFFLNQTSKFKMKYCTLMIKMLNSRSNYLYFINNHFINICSGIGFLLNARPPDDPPSTLPRYDLHKPGSSSTFGRNESCGRGDGRFFFFFLSFHLIGKGIDIFVVVVGEEEGLRRKYVLSFLEALRIVETSCSCSSPSVEEDHRDLRPYFRSSSAIGEEGREKSDEIDVMVEHRSGRGGADVGNRGVDGGDGDDDDDDDDGGGDEGGGDGDGDDSVPKAGFGATN